MSGHTNYYVVGKDLHDMQVKSLRSKDLFKLLNNHEYTPFLPSNVRDFQAEKEYGRIDKSMMVKYFILGMAETKEDLKTLLNPKEGRRLKNPKTRPMAEIKVPLTLYTLSKKAESAVRKQEKEAVKNTKAVIEKDILKNTKVIIERNILPGKPTSATPSNANKIAPKRPLDTLSQKGVSPRKIPKVPACEKCDILRTVNEQQAAQIASLTAALKSVSQEQLMVRMDSIDQSVKELLQTVTSQSIVSQSGNKWRHSGLDGCLDTLTDATEPSVVNDKVPGGKVFVGDGLFVSKEALQKINKEVFKLTLRVNQLCDLFWPGKVAQMSLSGNSSLQGDSIHISVAQTIAMKNILNLMKWDDMKDGEENYYVTDCEVKEQIRRYTSRLRSRALSASGKFLGSGRSRKPHKTDANNSDDKSKRDGNKGKSDKKDKRDDKDEDGRPDSGDVCTKQPCSKSGVQTEVTSYFRKEKHCEKEERETNTDSASDLEIIDLPEEEMEQEPNATDDLPAREQPFTEVNAADLFEEEERALTEINTAADMFAQEDPLLVDKINTVAGMFAEEDQTPDKNEKSRDMLEKESEQRSKSPGGTDAPFYSDSNAQV